MIAFICYDILAHVCDFFHGKTISSQPQKRVWPARLLRGTITCLVLLIYFSRSNHTYQVEKHSTYM